MNICISVFTGALFFMGLAARLHARVTIIAEPVVNLRSAPYAVPSYIRPPLLSGDLVSEHAHQNAQLLLNDEVTVIAVSDRPGWLYVQAHDLSHWCNGQWCRCDGYIEQHQVIEADYVPPATHTLAAPVVPVYQAPKLTSKKLYDLSLGTRVSAQEYDAQWLVVLFPDGTQGYLQKYLTLSFEHAQHLADNPDELRKSIVRLSKKLLDSPYLWGGNSGYNPNAPSGEITGFDCSGLTYLLYRVHGIVVPRNSRDQFLKTRKIPCGADLKPGDLIFSSRLNDPREITHVIMYSSKQQRNFSDEQNYAIECNGGGYYSVNEAPNKARLSTFHTPLEQLLGKKLGDIVCDGKPYFYNGRYFFFGSPLPQ